VIVESLDSVSLESKFSERRKRARPFFNAFSFLSSLFCSLSLSLSLLHHGPLKQPRRFSCDRARVLVTVGRRVEEEEEE